MTEVQRAPRRSHRSATGEARDTGGIGHPRGQPAKCSVIQFAENVLAPRHSRPAMNSEIPSVKLMEWVVNGYGFRTMGIMFWDRRAAGKRICCAPSGRN